MPNLETELQSLMQRFDEAFEHQDLIEITNRAHRKIIADFFLSEFQKLLKAREGEKKQLAEALLGMYNQYCGDGHSFMSAGENASDILEQQGYADFDGVGRLLTTKEAE